MQSPSQNELTAEPQSVDRTWIHDAIWAATKHWPEYLIEAACLGLSTAYLKVNGGSEAARRKAEEWLAPLKEHLSAASLGHTSEIFDGDARHLPVGCTAQEWSVAEVLRAALEDTYGIRPQQSAEPLEAVTEQSANRTPPAMELSWILVLFIYR